MEPAPGLALAPVLTEELSRFKMKFNAATAHDSYAAWREGDHDDLVLATALAAWWGSRMVAGWVWWLDPSGDEDRAE
jgi:hypothetical protein